MRSLVRTGQLIEHQQQQKKNILLSTTFCWYYCDNNNIIVSKTQEKIPIFLSVVVNKNVD